MLSSDICQRTVNHISGVTNYIFNQQLDEILYPLISAHPANPSVMEAAIRRGNLPLVKHLLKSGYPLSLQEIYLNGLCPRVNALQAAVALEQVEIVKVLVDKGAWGPPLKKLRSTRIVNAELIARSSPEILKIFLEKGLSPSAKIEGGINLLMLAAAGGKAGSIHLLISKGEKLETKDQDGDTPLIYAAKGGSTETVKALLMHNPKFYRFGSNGQNAKVAAFYLAEKSGVKILDIGAGAGKFCMIGSACTEGYFVGVEQRESLCLAARDISEKYHLTNVEFIHSNIMDVSFKEFDGFYFFNSFYENISILPSIDTEFELKRELYYEYSSYVKAQLDDMPIGTKLVTFHSFLKEIPDSYAVMFSNFDEKLKFWEKVH